MSLDNDKQLTPEDPGMRELARQLLPLSLSDAAMALADPLLAITLSRLPAPTTQLAALGVVKAVAVLLESPIIMVLHASTALGSRRPSREALRRFVVILASLLTVVLLLLSLPAPYAWLSRSVYNLSEDLADAAHLPLLLMCLWPALIAWRRIHQGHLILQGRGRAMGSASLARLGTLALLLFGGSQMGFMGATVGALALMGGLVVETYLVYRWSRQEDVSERPPATPLPETVPAVAVYYAPLALNMLLMWGGRAVLVAILARAVDSKLALAAWAASWGFVILIANLTRMVQQLVIKYALTVPASRLIGIGTWVGLACSLGLAALGYTPAGHSLLRGLIGGEPTLWQAAREVVEWSILVPLLVAYQNVLQGYCIVVGKKGWVNVAGLAGMTVTLAAAWYGINTDWPGATAGAVAIVVGLSLEVLVLLAIRPWTRLPGS